MFAVKTCDGLYHFTFFIDRFGIPSEIDHIHLSIEAQCVTHHLPPVDCHTHMQLMLNVLNLMRCYDQEAEYIILIQMYRTFFIIRRF